MHLIIQEKSRTMVKNYYHLQGVMEILREVVKLPIRNKKIFLFIILSTIFSSVFVILLTGILAVIYLLTDSSMMSVFSMGPTSPEYLKQLSKLTEYGMLLAFGIILLMTVVILFSMVATIHVSAMSYLGRDLTVKDLFSKIRKIWIRPVVTCIYISLLMVGYSLLNLPLQVFVVSARGSIIVVVVGIGLILLAVFVGMYFSLVCMLSFVISVLEDCYGLQALGKAEELVKGRKVVGIVLSFGFMILSVPIALVSIINMSHGVVAIQFLVTFVTLSLIILVKMLSMMTYTVFYFEHKQSHGKQGEVEEDIGYNRVSSEIPLDV